MSNPDGNDSHLPLRVREHIREVDSSMEQLMQQVARLRTVLIETFERETVEPTQARH
jgi:hypothetical protein